MGLFDFLNTNENDGEERGDDHFDYSKGTDMGFVESLVSLFVTKPAVLKAYFGLLYDEEKDDNDLFLAVEHLGEVEGLKKMTHLIKKTFLPDVPMFYTSTEDQPELLGYIEETNFPFYVKDKPQPLNILVMKQWFDPTYKKSFIEKVKTSKVTSLFKDFNPLGKGIDFQTFVREGKEFIPLFSGKEMIFKSGMTEVPSDLTVAEFDWRKIDEAIDGSLKEHFYVLNPGTSFEVEFHA
ncbi:enhanced serine sensitivity protein SseB C-terminal domain-containing protein [Pedobacter sp. NJ-S-72]